METTNKAKCRQCKRTLIDVSFYYNGKMHKTCFACSTTRINKQNVCSVCGKRAIYNIAGTNIGVRCSSHRDANMVDVKHPKCIKCKIKIPTFNKEGESQRLYCSGCAEPGMVDVKHPKCIKCKIKRPNCNKEGEAKALYCRGCAEPGMVDVISFKCIKCKIKHPAFNNEGDTRALYCRGCAEPSMEIGRAHV